MLQFHFKVKLFQFSPENLNASLHNDRVKTLYLCIYFQQMHQKLKTKTSHVHKYYHEIYKSISHVHMHVKINK